MVKIQKIHVISVLFLAVLCCGSNHVESTSVRQDLQKKTSPCFSELANLIEYSVPESCRQAGIHPAKVSENLLIGMLRDSSYSVFFIEKKGRLELIFGYKNIDLSRIHVFGPGSVLVNDHVCQKHLGELQCPVEALRS